MKTTLQLLFLLVGFGLWAQMPPYTRTQLTTNTAEAASFRREGNWRAFGDSFTRGTGATTSNLCWVARLAAAANRGITNLGSSGKELQDISWTIMGTSVAARDSAWLLTGFNDMRFQGGSADTLNGYRSNLRACLAYLAIPATNRIYCTNFTFTGTWGDFTLWTLPSKYSTTAASTAQFTAYGDTIYLAWANRHHLGNGGTATVAVDGVNRATIDSRVGESPYDSATTVHWPGLTRISGLTNGSHTVLITVSGVGYVDFQWAAGNGSLIGADLPAVYSSGPPRMNAAGYALGGATGYTNGTDAVCQDYNTANTEVCAELAADGLNVTCVDVARHYVPESGHVYGDNIHPNDTGHLRIAQAFIDSAFYRKRVDPVVARMADTANIKLPKPQTVDLFVNYAFSVTGPSAPSLATTTNSGPIKVLAFDNGDILYGQTQMPHNLAVTNSLYPKWIWDPHIHFSTIGTLDNTHSNVTWRLEWEIANINGLYNVRGTNSATMGVTNNYTHYMLSLGPITNDPPPSASAVVRMRLMRPASGAQDYSNDHDVLLDAFDLHVPVGNKNMLGTTSE